MPWTFRIRHKTAPLSIRIRSRDSCVYMYWVIRFLGWMAPEKGIKRYVYMVYSVFVFSFATVYLPLGLVLSLINDFATFTPGDFLGIIQITTNITGGAIKGILLRIMLYLLHQADSMLDQLDEHVHSKEDRQKIHKAVARSNYIFYVIGMFYWVYTMSVLIVAIIIGQPPWIVYNPVFDWRGGLLNLWMQAMMEYMMMFMMATSILILDTFPLMYVIILRAHVRILMSHIESLRDSSKEENANYADLVNCIEHHKKILDCVNIIRPIVSLEIFLQFLLIGTVYGIILVNVIYFSGILRGIASLVFLLAVSLQTFPFCYQCDLLVKDCEDLSNSLFHSRWIDAEPKFRNTIKIFLHHVQEPIIFIAGGIFPISMNTNIKVAKFAFSVMTIVQNMNLAERFSEDIISESN